MRRVQKKISVMCSALFVIFNPTPVLAAESGGFVSNLFDSITRAVTPYFNIVAAAIRDFYAEYAEVGMVVAVIVLILAVVAFFFLLVFLKFLLHKLYKLFRIVTGMERRKKERLEMSRVRAAVRREEYKNLLRFNNTTTTQSAGHRWENEVAKAAAEITAANAMNKGADEQLWRTMISGVISYDNKLTEIEKTLFALEDKIHDVISKITSLPKEELVMETAQLRVGLEALNKDTDCLRKLQESFPEDANITSLIELCEAFIQATKGVEKGFIAALEG